MSQKKKLYWTFQLSGWTIFGLMQIIGAKVVSGEQSLSWKAYSPFIVESVFFLFATHLARTLIIKRSWLGKRMIAIIPRVFTIAIVIACLAYAVRIATIIITGELDQAIFEPPNIIGNILANAFIIFIWAVFYFVYHYFESYNKSLKYEAAIHEIELNNLKSQLNPHFMFNALNSIRALVDDEPEKSKVAVTQLSNILRNSLATDQKRLITFKQELSTVKDYLSLEKIRYEERLDVSYQIDKSGHGWKVPPLMVQTLVENGIKHGISKLKKGGELELESKVVDDRLHIKIINSGSLKQGSTNSARGLGIKNTVKRLELIYGEDATFKIYNCKTNNRVITEISLPDRPDL